MSDNITELMTYAAMKGDPKLMGLLSGAMGEIEVSENPKQLAKASRIVASSGMALAGIGMVFNNMAEIGRDGKALILDIENNHNK